MAFSLDFLLTVCQYWGDLALQKVVTFDNIIICKKSESTWPKVLEFLPNFHPLKFLKSLDTGPTVPWIAEFNLYRLASQVSIAVVISMFNAGDYFNKLLELPSISHFSFATFMMGLLFLVMH